MQTLDRRIAEMHIPNFCGMINMTNEYTPRDKVTMLPPLGRARCLQVVVVEIEATPPPEALQHIMSMGQDRVNISFEYRGM